MNTRLMKVAVLALAVSCLLAVSRQAAADDGKSNVMATTFPVHLITAAVVKGDPGLNLQLLLSPSLGCPHNYVLTPGDIRRIDSADIIVTNGLGHDEFINETTKGRKDGAPVILDSSRGLRGLMNYADRHHADHDGHDKDGHEEHPAHQKDVSHKHEGVNPHLFASPIMAASIALNIATQMSSVRPAMASLYQANAAAFAARMTVLDADFKIAVSRLKNRRIVTQHGAFDYLARDVGLEIVTVILADPGSQPSASEMLELVRKIRKAGAGAVFAEPQFGSKMPATVAREAGIPMDILDPVATGPDGAGPDYYEKVMRTNITVLEKTLGTR